MSNESKKNWERPWSTEEIVDHADNWNLACDAALLNTLKIFGDKILNKSEEVHNKVDSLCNNLNQISLRVDLARNEFNSLRNTQFVECRVYEEDETLLSTQEQEEKADKDVPKVETMEDLQQAVELGLQILDKYYDKLEVTVSDSEDDDDEVPSYVYRRKDPYLHRPLPYVIGSEEWYKKWHVGLQESSDSENEKSSSDKFSDSENDDNFEIKDHSDVSSELSNLSSTNDSKGQPAAVSTANTTQHNDFLSSTIGSNSSETPTPKVLSFAEQLAAKLGNVIKENESLLEEPQVNRRPIQKKPSDYGALFSDEPPPLDDSVIKEQEHQGIFSGGKGLFDDEDDDNDTLWNPVKSNTSSTDQHGFNKSGNTAVRPIQSKGLFDEDSDDDIFSSVPIGMKNQIKQPYLQTIKPPAPAFHEEPPLLEEEKEVKEKKKPAGGVSVFGKTDIFQNRNIEDILKQKRVSSSEESIEDISSPKIIRKIPESKTSAVSKQEGSSHSTNIEKIYSNKPIISNVPKVTERVERKRPNEKKNSLFEDNEPTSLGTVKQKNTSSSIFDDIFGDDLFSDTNKKFSSNLFSEEDLFSEGKMTKPSETDKKSTEAISDIVSKKERAVVSEDKLFEDIQQPSDIKNEYDYSWRDNSKNKIGSLFDDMDDDDFDTFLTTKKSNSMDEQNNNKKKEETSKDFQSVNTNNKESNTKKPTLDLFDDEFDDVDDLFSNILKKGMTETKSSSKKPQKEFFQSKKQERISDSLKTVEKVPIISSKEPDITAGPTIVPKAKSNSYSTKKETSDRPKLISENLVGGREFLESTTSVLDKQEGFIREENLKSSETRSLGRISGEETLPSAKTEELDYITSNPKLNVENDANNTTAPPRHSTNIPHVNFLDSIPPPDDGWENASDNIFDDVEPYGNDGFHSQPSSLFDNEPPSLFFNDTSGIVRDDVENRIDSVNSFDPSLTSSRRLSSDIFSDTQNDSFPTKNQDGTNIPSQPNLQSVLEISDSFLDDNTDLTPSGHPDELYSSITVSKSIDGVDGSVAELSRHRKSDQLPNKSQQSCNFPNIDEGEYVDENKVSLKTPVNAKNPIFTKEDKQKSKTSINLKNTEDLSESEEYDVKDIFTGKPTSSESGSEPNRTETKPVSMFDDLFDKPGPDAFSVSKGSVNKPKISLKPSLGINDENNQKYSGTINPSQTDVKSETDVFENVYNARVDREKIFKEKHKTNLIEESTGSLFEDIFGEQVAAENADIKPKITAKPFISETKITRKKNQTNVSDKLNSIENNFKSDISTEEQEQNVSIGVPVGNSKKPISLFDDKSDKKKTECTNQVITKTMQDNDLDDFINRENVISDNVNTDKDIAVKENAPAEESLLSGESDEMQSNIAKIAERLQQKTSKEDDKPKTTVVPGKLSHKLNINVGALLPGSSPPRRDKVRSPDVKSSEATSEEPDFLTKPIPILRTQSETHSVEREYKLEKSVSFDNTADVEVLQSVTKNRPKIPVKRRPSSRRARQQSLKDSIPDISITDDSIPGEKYEKSITKDLDSSDVHAEAIKSTTEISRQNEDQGSGGESAIVDNPDLTLETIEKANNKSKTSDTRKEESKNDIKKNVSLFDEKEDETEDLFRTIQKDVKNVNKAKIVHTKKDLLSEADLFGNAINESKEDTKFPKAAPRKLKKKKEFENLFDSSDDSDELRNSDKEISEKSRNDQITTKKNKPSIIGNIVEKDSSSKRDNENVKSANTLFDSSDEDDFLKTLATRSNSQQEQTSSKTLPVKINVKSGNKLFDDENGDGDIFGVSSSIRPARHDTQPSVINKKTPKSSSLRKLENVEGDEDPLSALLK